MNRTDMVREWLEYAANDLRIAAHIFDSMWPRPLENVCYHCQQAVEKALKGFLVSLDTDPPKTHDLVKLCDLCAEQDPSFAPMRDACRKMTDYSATARYPGGMEIEETDAVFALKETEKIYNVCIGLLPELTREQEQEPAQNPEQSMY